MNAPAASPSSVYREIASAIGRTAARQLVETLGGQRFYVPRSVGPNHAIARAIGPDAAAELARYFHGTWLALPMPASLSRNPASVRAIAATDPALTRQKLAGQTGYSERQVYRILDDDRRQPSLFDGQG